MGSCLLGSFVYHHDSYGHQYPKTLDTIFYRNIKLFSWEFFILYVAVAQPEGGCTPAFFSENLLFLSQNVAFSSSSCKPGIRY